jgi:hypothetical protein
MMSHLLKLKAAVCIIAYESGSQKGDVDWQKSIG